MLLTLNNQELEKLITESKQFISTGEGKEAIKELVEAQKIIEGALLAVKQALSQSLQNEGLKFVVHDNVKVTVSESGAKYKLLDETVCPPECMNVKLDPKAVEAWIENHNSLPDGVTKAQRSNAIRIEVK